MVKNKEEEIKSLVVDQLAVTAGPFKPGHIIEREKTSMEKSIPQEHLSVGIGFVTTEPEGTDLGKRLHKPAWQAVVFQERGASSLDSLIIDPNIPGCIQIERTLHYIQAVLVGKLVGNHVSQPGSVATPQDFGFAYIDTDVPLHSPGKTVGKIRLVTNIDHYFFPGKAVPEKGSYRFCCFLCDLECEARRIFDLCGV